MRARWWKWCGLGVVILAVVVFASVWLGTGTHPNKPPKPPVNRAIVTLGDSVLAGEGVPPYEPGTNGTNGDFCHRSKAAEVLRTRIPHYPFRYNFACSGATTANIDQHRQYGEPVQTAGLARVAKQHPVGAVVVTVGANDDPDFTGKIEQCVEASLFGSPCSRGFDQQWRARVDRMVPKVSAALRAVRATMRQAGYRDGGYQLIVQSYASPLGPDVRSDLRNLNGCPFTQTDLRWIRNTGVHVLDDGLRRAARQVGARYLDMSSAGHGHEACTGNGKGHQEWFNRLRINWQDLKVAARADHAVNGSFHPNRAGQAAFAGCLSKFVTAHASSAACVPAGNRLRLTTGNGQ